MLQYTLSYECMYVYIYIYIHIHEVVVLVTKITKHENTRPHVY